MINTTGSAPTEAQGRSSSTRQGPALGAVGPVGDAAHEDAIGVTISRVRLRCHHRARPRAGHLTHSELIGGPGDYNRDRCTDEDRRTSAVTPILSLRCARHAWGLAGAYSLTLPTSERCQAEKLTA